MNSTNFIASWYSCFFVTLVVIILSLNFVLQNTPPHIFSSNGPKKISFSSSSDNDNKMALQPEVMIPTLQVGRARYDNQRILRIYDFYFTGNQWESLLDKYDICFATQASVEKMYWIPYILERWTGPLSIAIQLISEEEWLIFNFYINYLIKCNSTFKSQVALHLAVPANLSALKIDDKITSQWGSISLEAIWKQGETCPDATEYMKFLLDTLPTTDLGKLAYKEFYPQNHMRNIGRKGCGTHWTYSADVDIIPVSGMADKLQHFYTEQKVQGKLCAKCAYVIPTFELNDTFPFPESKTKVVEYFRTGAAQQYYNNFPSTHDATQYEWWSTNKLEEEDVTISHEISRTKLKHYEPFYISPDNIAPFDERFLGYGYTRLSQFQAAITTGWNFSVITPVFSIHWGFQNNATYNSPRKGGFGKVVRREHFMKNHRIYESFLKELECKEKNRTPHSITSVT